MFYQTEAKAQGWRAMATFKDGRSDALLLLGRSSTQIRQNYVEAFMEVLDDEERDAVGSVSMEKWTGAGRRHLVPALDAEGAPARLQDAPRRVTPPPDIRRGRGPPRDRDGTPRVHFPRRSSTSPPTAVVSTSMSLIASGSADIGSSASGTNSGRSPAAMLPLDYSSNEA